MKTRQYILPLKIERLEDGRYLARSLRLPGLNVQGDSMEEVMKLAPKVARSLISAMKSKGVPLPRGLTSPKTPLTLKLLIAV